MIEAAMPGLFAPEEIEFPITNLLDGKLQYTTARGRAYLGESLSLIKSIPSNSIDLIVTSPPYALEFKKAYGNKSKEDYLEWFLEYAYEMHRVLKDTGSLVINIGGSYNKGTPTKSLYHFKLLIELVERANFHLAQEMFWYNPAKMPVPAEWVTVRRIRVKESVEYVWWLSKTAWPKANNRNVLKEYSEDMKRLNAKGLEYQERPSGHAIRPSFSEISAGGSIPSNVLDSSLEAEDMLKFGNNAANDAYSKHCKINGIKPHPARFPASLPEFFIRLLTNEGDLVLDPFAGSNTTGMVAERNDRLWLSCDNVEEYVAASEFRFRYK